MPRILIVDDEEPLRQSLSYQLAREGFTVVAAADGPEALAATEAETFDVILLDVMLPKLSGMEVCRQIREKSDVPIVMLTAKDHGADKVSGLELGADDYVTKPFNSRELIARLRAVMRRRASVEKLVEEDRGLLKRMENMLRHSGQISNEKGSQDLSANSGTIEAGPIIIDLDTASVMINGKSVVLAPPEYGLLRILILSRGSVVTRTELIQRIWGPSSRDALLILEGHIRCLREKIEKDPANPRWLVTVPGIGFRFV